MAFPSFQHDHHGYGHDDDHNDKYCAESRNGVIIPFCVQLLHAAWQRKDNGYDHHCGDRDANDIHHHCHHDHGYSFNDKDNDDDDEYLQPARSLYIRRGTERRTNSFHRASRSAAH